MTVILQWVLILKKSLNVFIKEWIEIPCVCNITKLAKTSRKSHKKESVLLVAVLVRKWKYILGFHLVNCILILNQTNKCFSVAAYKLQID